MIVIRNTCIHISRSQSQISIGSGWNIVHIAVGILRIYFEICFYETKTRIQCTFVQLYINFTIISAIVQFFCNQFRKEPVLPRKNVHREKFKVHPNTFLKEFCLIVFQTRRLLLWGNILKGSVGLPVTKADIKGIFLWKVLSRWFIRTCGRTSLV